MIIEGQRITIRPFEKRDAHALFHIAREKQIVRFMKDWSEDFDLLASYDPFINWMQSVKDSTDVNQNKRYVIALTDTDEMIGMIGMGLEETLGEVELAYFMSENFQRKGYTTEAIGLMCHWCFANSPLEFLILTIDTANTPSHKVAEKCGFELFEKRYPIGHQQPNMESDSYYYYRLYRKNISTID